jgi:hypothetical protein
MPDDQPNTAGAEWLILILTIPGQQSALRVRTWRRLRALGAGALRDGVYLLPNRPDLHEALQTQVQEVTAADGNVQLLEVSMGDGDYAHLFDRSEEYRAVTEAAKAALPTRGRPLLAQATRTLEQLQREFETIVARDFFPDANQEHARRALGELRIHVERLRTPDEPQPVRGRIERLDRERYEARTWVTRERPWVDRLASAWLIRRFIDPQARFRWVKRPPQRLGKALGFDFDGATFTHVDEKVTFEVLLVSFGLETDPALVRIAAIVHYLDVGGFPVPESAAIEAALRGMRARTDGDDRLLERASQLFDDLYAGYAELIPRHETADKTPLSTG